MKKRWLMLVPILFLFDRAVKIWAARDLINRPGGAIELIPGVVRLRYIENDGAAFSLFSGNSMLLIGLTSAIMLAILAYLIFARRPNRPAWFALAVVLAGGLGNLFDRIAYASVIDYIEPLFIRFAIFNLADIFVVLGAICFAFLLLRADRKGDALRS